MKLSEFKDEKAIEVVANLLEPIANIAKNQANQAAKGGTKLEIASAMLKNNAKDVMTMLAILADEDPETYHCSAATVLADVLNMLTDTELMQLFGLQSKTAASSGSASESTEAQEG
jgi:hypothetical protein